MPHPPTRVAVCPDPWRSGLDNCHVTRYISIMIRTFADKRTAELFAKGSARGIPPDVIRRAVRRMEYVDLATRLDDLRTPPGNRLHALKGDRSGQHAIAVNDQWRVCFRFVDGDAYDVEFCDYH